MDQKIILYNQCKKDPKQVSIEKLSRAYVIFSQIIKKNQCSLKKKREKCMCHLIKNISA